MLLMLPASAFNVMADRCNYLLSYPQYYRSIMTIRKLNLYYFDCHLMKKQKLLVPLL